MRVGGIRVIRTVGPSLWRSMDGTTAMAKEGEKERVCAQVWCAGRQREKREEPA